MAGVFYYDEPRQQSTFAVRLTSNGTAGAPLEIIETRQQTMGFRYTSLAGMCPRPPTTAAFSPPWQSFLYQRTVVENGRAVLLYKSMFADTFVVLDAKSGAPLRTSNRQLRAPNTYNGTWSEYSFLTHAMYNIEFYNTTIYEDNNGNDDAAAAAAVERKEDEDPSVYEPPAICRNQTEITYEGGGSSVGGLLCPSNPSSIVNISMVRTHSSGDYSLTNHNTADMRGDTQYVQQERGRTHARTLARSLTHSLIVNSRTRFICMRNLSPQDTSLVSTFMVAVNTSFGPYTFCNFGFCAGWQSGRVGRRVNWRYACAVYRLPVGLCC